MLVVEIVQTSPNKIISWRTLSRVLHRFPLSRVLHRLKGPAHIIWHSTSPRKHLVAYIKHGNYHREEERPSYTVWHPNGQKSYESYDECGVLHRTGGLPAVTEWSADGRKNREEWWEKGCFKKKGV